MPHSDAELVRRFLARQDERAFRQLVERHAATVLRAAHAVTGDLQAAEDATQESFLAACRALRRYDPRRSLRAWLVGIAVKRASKLVRRRVRLRRRETEVAMTPKPRDPQPREEAQRRESEAALGRALAELAADKRLALLLHYREGLSHAEVAEAMRVAPGTAKSRISRALEALREKLGSRGASLAVADLPLLLQRLPGPTPSPGLIAACAAKAGGTAASVLPKLIATAMILGAGALVTVVILNADRERAPRRDSRTTSVADGATPAGAHEGRASSVARGTPGGAEQTEVTQPVAPTEGTRPSEKERKPASTAWSGEEGTVVIDGKEYRIRGLPGNVSVTPKGETGGTLGPGKTPRFAPRPVPGRWSKWAPLPRFRGGSALSGRVVDANDVPVKGAEVFRMAAGVDRSASTVISFEHLARIATTKADGTFVAGRQQHGTFLLAVNYQRLMNRPRGMETAHAVQVTVLEDGRTERIELRLPARVAELAPLRGVVKDEEGQPVRGARIFVDYLERRSDAAGRFDAGFVPEGERAVVVTKTGYETLKSTIAVVRGRENVAELILSLVEAGGLRLAGQILDDAGNPVPDAVLYLTARYGTVRAIRSDAQGRYAFEKLPDHLAEQQVDLHVHAQGYFPRHMPDVPPLPLDPYEVRLDRAIRVVVMVVSAGTGEPLQQIVGKMEHERVKDSQIERVKYRSWSVYREDGVLGDIDCPAGRVYITLEAPGHLEREIELDLDAAEGRREITVALDASPATPVED
ncbi:MAG: sigma-70 family RNA polymerase sigma factor [Planctomycetota bacterium]